MLPRAGRGTTPTHLLRPQLAQLVPECRVAGLATSAAAQTIEVSVTGPHKHNVALTMRRATGFHRNSVVAREDEFDRWVLGCSGDAGEAGARPW